MTLLLRRDKGLLANAPSPCGNRVLHRFLAGRAVPATCTPPGPLDAVTGNDDALVFPPEPVPPMGLGDVLPARVLGAVVATLNDVVDEAERGRRCRAWRPRRGALA